MRQMHIPDKVERAQVYVRLPRARLEKLRRRAQRTDLSLNWLINEALRVYLGEPGEAETTEGE